MQNKLTNIYKSIISIFKTEYEEFKKFCIIHKSSICITIFFAILTYGFLISNFIIGVDTDRALMHGASFKGFLAQGRFMIALSRKLFSSIEIVPFITPFLAMTTMLISGIYLSKNLNNVIKRNDKIPTLIFMCLFITMPLTMHWMYFKTYDFDVCLGYIYVAIANSFACKYVINKSSKINAIFAIIFMAFSIGVYQSFVTVNIILLCTQYILHTITKKDISLKESFQILFKFIFILLLGIVLFFAIKKVINVFFVPSDNYVEGFIQIGNRDTIQYLNDVKQRFIDIFITSHYTGTKVLAVTSCLAILIIIVNFIKFKSYKILNNLCIIAMFICPFLISLAIFTLMPFRTYQDVVIIPSVIWYIFYYLILDKIKFKQISVAIFLIVALYCSLNQAHYANKIVYVNYLRYEQDVFVVNKIVNDIYSLGVENINSYPVVYLGNRDIVETNYLKKESRGWMEANNEFSNLMWYYRNTGSISNFTISNGHVFRGATKEVIEGAAQLGIDMPSYPNEGYVQIREEGFIIVKLSEYLVEDYIRQ